jgi:hypothetical protein
MRFFFLTQALLIVSCSTMNPVPEGAQSNKSVEYCGGELWGYVLPIGPRENADFWTRKFDDPKPVLALFMHLHSVLETDPEHALTLHLALRSRESMSAQFPDNKVRIQIGDGIEKTFALELRLVEDARTVENLYPDLQYKTELIDGKTNQWRIAKRNSFFTVITDEPKLILLPTSRVTKITNAPLNVVFDDRNYSQVFILAEKNIWPEHQPLKDAVIKVRLPKFSLNGADYGPQDFVFNMSYEKVRKNRASYGRCPSTDEIFRFNKR